MPVYVIETTDGKSLPTPAFVVANKPQQAARVWAQSQVKPRLASALESLMAEKKGAIVLFAVEQDEGEGETETETGQGQAEIGQGQVQDSAPQSPIAPTPPPVQNPVLAEAMATAGTLGIAVV